MVKDERVHHALGVDQESFHGIVGSDRLAGRLPPEDHRAGVKSGVPAGIRVDAKEGEVGDIKPGLLHRFSPGGGLAALPAIDETARQGEPMRRVLPLDEDELSLHLDQDVDGE